MHYFRALRRDSTRSLPLSRIKWPQRNVLGFGVILGLVLGTILAVPLSRTSLIVTGQPSPVTLEAPRSISFSSEVRTRAEQTAAENQVAPQYRTDTDIPDQQRRALVAALDAIAQIRANPSLGVDGQVAGITTQSEPPMTAAQAQTVLNFSDDEWQRIYDETRRLYDGVLNDRNNALTEEDVEELRERELPTTPDLPGVSEEQREIILHFVASFLKPNRFVDLAATERLRAEARTAVSPVQVSIARGQNVVRRGEIVTEEDFEALTELGLVRGAGGLLATMQMLLLGALTAWLFATYVNYCQETLWHNGRGLSVVGGLLAVALFAGRLMLPGWGEAPYAFPLATMSILITILFNGQLALVATLAIAPLIGLQHEQSVALGLTLALGSAAGSFTAQRARRTSQFAVVGLSVAVATALAALVFWVDASDDANDLAQIMLFSVVNGGLASILALGVHHFLGRIAGVVTPLELMELSHPNQPLLRRLMREAPGTYHHSMVVGNLAEVAAENIGADSLLTRVGAYYHDVGKLLRPYFFTDNQHDRSNVHDVLDAKTSASIIIDHVREGAKLARDNGLPQRVVDFIPQHHGTNLVSYFYQRALQEDEEADIEAFRYPGPKPQTREAAIMMLADGVEATVRAKAQAGKLRPARPEENGDVGAGQTITEIVDQIVAERIASGQLDEAPLTLHDISVIKESFVQTLQGIYHPRVDYPAPRGRQPSRVVEEETPVVSSP